MPATLSRKIVLALQYVLLAFLIGLPLYLYNDYKDSQAEAITDTESINIPETEGVDGVVEIGPDGIINRPDTPDAPPNTMR